MAINIIHETCLVEAFEVAEMLEPRIPAERKNYLNRERFKLA